MRKFTKDEIEFLSTASKAMETPQDIFIAMFEADIKAGLIKERQGI